MNNNVPLSAIDDGPVDAALADYFDRVDRGESIELTEIIAAHPGCETGLRQFLNQERKLHEAVAVVSLPSTAAENLTGRTLGDFRLERVIGRGGMGVVWQAKQLSLGRTSAVKLLPAALCSDSRHRARFQNEARILAQLEHANIVNVLAVGEDADTYYFAMQYVEGMTADELIQLWKVKSSWHNEETARGLNSGDTTVVEPGEAGDKRASGQLPPWVAHCDDRRERYRMCARIAAEVADGLAHAHACGVLHRDVKPSNILLDKSGMARLSDFGLARMCGDATLTATGAILGTLRYASPEQLGGTSAAVDERSDVYSLGVTLWELVTGERLFMAENHNTVISQVLNVDAPRPSLFAARLPRDLETVIARAMAKEPRDRYVSAQAFGDDLRRYLDGRPIEAKPLSRLERAFRWANRNRALTTAATGSLIVLAAVSLLATGLVLQANSRTATALTASRDSEAEARENATAAKASERKTRELYYAADMSLAAAAWHKHEFAYVRAILDRYARPKTRADGSTEEDQRGFEWYFLDRQTRTSSELLYENKEPLYLIQFMPDGGEFLTAGKDSIVRWHDADTGAVARSLDTKQGEVNCVSYNPSRTQFATAGEDGTVKFWNAVDLSLVNSMKALDGTCHWAKYLNDEMVITGGYSEVHRLFHVATGQLLREYAMPDAKLADGESPRSSNAYLDKAGDHFWTTANSASGTFRGIYKWGVETGESRKFSTDDGLCNVLMDDSEKFLFVNTLNGDVRILDAQSGDELWSHRLGSRLEAMSLSPDERRLVVGDRSGQIYVWDVDLSNPSKIIPAPSPRAYSIHKSIIDSMAFGADGKSLVTVGRDGCVHRTNIVPQEPFRDVTSLFKYTSPLKVSGTDQVAVFPNEPLRFSRPAIKRFSLLHYPPTAAVSDGTLVAAMGYDHLGIMNLATGEVVFKCGFIATPKRNLDFSSDNSLLAVVSNDNKSGRIDLVDLRTGKLDRFSDPGTTPSWAQFCINDGLIVWVAPGKFVCWNVLDRTIRWEIKPFGVRCDRVSISPDRKSLISTDRQDIAQIDCATGKVRYRTRCEYLIDAIAFVSNGRSFVVGGKEGQLSIWHAGTGQHLFEIANIGSAYWNIQPLENGFLASTSRVKDGRTERVWLEF